MFNQMDFSFRIHEYRLPMHFSQIETWFWNRKEKHVNWSVKGWSHIAQFQSVERYQSNFQKTSYDYLVWSKTLPSTFFANQKISQHTMWSHKQSFFWLDSKHFDDLKLALKILGHYGPKLKGHPVNCKPGLLQASLNTRARIHAPMCVA